MKAWELKINDKIVYRTLDIDLALKQIPIHLLNNTPNNVKITLVYKQVF